MKNSATSNTNPLLMAAARVVSLLFHPLFVLSYGVLLLVVCSPYHFGHTSAWQVIVDRRHGAVLIWVFMLTVFFPALSILIMRGTGLLSSLHMPEKQDRYLPYIGTGLFYLWAFVNLQRFAAHPLCEVFALGATLSLFLAFFINIFVKISLHAIGAGGLLGMVILTMTASHLNLTPLFLIALPVVGLIGTSRLLLKAHEPQEVYFGYFLGFCTPFLALRVLLPDYFAG